MERYVRVNELTCIQDARRLHNLLLDKFSSKPQIVLGLIYLVRTSIV